MIETNEELGAKATNLSGEIEPIELSDNDFFNETDFPTNYRFTDIPFEVVAPTIHRQTIIIHRTIVIQQPTPTTITTSNDPTYNRQPTPTITTYEPTDNRQPTLILTVDMVRIGKAIGGTVGYVAFGTVKIVWGMFSGIISILVSMIQTCFEGSNDGYRQSGGNMHKWPDSRKMYNNNGSVNTVRDININVHIGDNNK